MKIEIYCNDSLIILLSNRPLTKKESETQLEYSGKKALREIVFDFEKKGNKSILSIWSEDDFDRLVKAFFSLHQRVEAAGGVVFNEHEELLFIHRNGKWDLPKGKISGKDRRKAEKNRSAKPEKLLAIDFEEQIARIAAIREVKEETGLKNIKISSELPITYHIYFNGDRGYIKQTRWYRMESTTEESLKPQISEGIIIVRWIPKNSLACIFAHTYESLKPLIKSVLGNT
ncbi:MAG: NUDIX hydrolase [Bacteroidales bacterium]